MGGFLELRSVISLQAVETLRRFSIPSLRREHPKPPVLTEFYIKGLDDAWAGRNAG